MTARKIKHQRALEKREKYMTTVKEGNLTVLNKVRDQRADEEKRAQEALKQKKIQKSKELARQNGVAKKVPTHKPLPKQARKKINGKKEQS
jgi:hypothetical protein